MNAALAADPHTSDATMRIFAATQSTIDFKGNGLVDSTLSTLTAMEQCARARFHTGD